MIDKYSKYGFFGYIVLVVISTILLPPFNIISPDNYLFPFIFLLLFIRNFNNKVFLTSLLITGALGFTLLLSNYLNFNVSISHMTRSVRWFKLFCIGWCIYELIVKYNWSPKRLIDGAFLLVVIINALMLLQWGGLLELYSPNGQLSSIQQHSIIDARLNGTVLNPNNNGLLFALFAVYYLITETKYRYTFVAISILLVIMSQSRTAFISVALAGVVIALIHLLRKDTKYIIFIIVAAFIGIIGVWQLKLTNLSSLLDGTAFSSNSLLNRFDIISNVIEMNRGKMWFGSGEIDNIPELLGGSIDNEFAFLYLRTGLVGLLVFLLSLAGIVVYVMRKSASANSILLVLVMLFGGLTNLSFTNLTLGPVFIILFVAAAFSESRIDLTYKKKTSNYQETQS